jgi:predicted anti-sigma-YlaC factor YlaD
MDSRRDEPTGMGDPRRPPQDSSGYVRHTAEHEITCQQFVELVTDYFEGALPARTRTHVEEHLVMCDWCVTYTEQMRDTIVALNELGSEPSPGEPAEGEPLVGEPSPVIMAALRGRRDAAP